MTRRNWFDPGTEVPLIEERVRQLESFTRALEDGVIEKQELQQQQERLVAAMKAVEDRLDDQQHGLVTDLLVELSAYDVMRLLHELQSSQLQAALGREA